jgi:gluconokinase
MVGATHRHRPIAANVALYAQLLPIFDALPRLLEVQYGQIADFQRRAAGGTLPV